MSLLLLRSVLGVAMIVGGASYLREPNPTLAMWFLGLSGLAAGILFLVGFLTPLIGIVVIVVTVIAAVSSLPSSLPNVFESKLALIFALTMVLTIIGTGPGRFSLDARVFGRREIIIPPAEFPPRR